MRVAAAPKCALCAVEAELGKALVELLDGQSPRAELADSGRIREKPASWKGMQGSNSGRMAAFAVMVTDTRDAEFKTGKDAIDQAALSNSRGADERRDLVLQGFDQRLQRFPGVADGLVGPLPRPVVGFAQV